MNKKAKLSQLNKQLQEKPKQETHKSQKTQKTQNTDEANPIRGERGDFLKVTITLPPEMLGDLKRLGIEKKLKGQKDSDVSSLIRDAVVEFLKKQ